MLDRRSHRLLSLGSKFQRLLRLLRQIPGDVIQRLPHRLILLQFLFQPLQQGSRIRLRKVGQLLCLLVGLVDRFALVGGQSIGQRFQVAFLCASLRQQISVEMLGDRLEGLLSSLVGFLPLLKGLRVAQAIGLRQLIGRLLHLLAGGQRQLPTEIRISRQRTTGGCDQVLRDG